MKNEKKSITEKEETLKEPVTFEFKIKTAKEKSGYMAMCGWHSNFVELLEGEEKIGTVTFINGSLGIHGKDKRKVIHINLMPLIELAMEKLK